MAVLTTRDRLPGTERVVLGTGQAWGADGGRHT
jgi:hypothetical protein